MTEPNHVNFLRSLPHVFGFNQEIKDAIYMAADYIDELEGQIKLLNKLGNIESTGSSISDRLTALEERLNRTVTNMHLEDLAVQLRGEFSRFANRK